MRSDSYHPKREPEFDCDISFENIKNIFSGCEDFYFREIRLGLEKNIFCAVCWIDGLVNEEDISRDMLRPLTDHERLRAADSARRAVRLIEQGAVYRGTQRTRDAMDDLVSDLMAGHAALIFEGLHLAVTFEVKSTQGRPVSEAAIEKAVKGPRDAFVETLRINTGLIVLSEAGV